MAALTLEQRQAACKTSQKERAERRAALLAEKRKAKKIKGKFREAQRQHLLYVRRKNIHKHLRRQEVEIYKASVRAFNDLCTELRDCAAVLRNARTSYESTLTKAQREALEYASGFNAGREMGRKEHRQERGGM